MLIPYGVGFPCLYGYGCLAIPSDRHSRLDLHLLFVVCYKKSIMEDNNKDYHMSEFKFDIDNKAFFNASRIVLETEQPLMYLTGKAGTGKTTFLKYISINYDKNHVILAPTGLAAVNAGGQTIHSFFKLGFTPYLPDDNKLQKEHIKATFKYNQIKIDMIRNLSLIIIDEISMVRCDILDIIDLILRTYRKSDKPFGGVRMLLIGDTFQLPPIAKSDEWNILQKFYATPYFFSSKVYENTEPIYIELNKHYRQTETEFLNLLDKIRINDLNEEDFKLLDLRVLPPVKNKYGEEPILLAPTNYVVNMHNEKKFNELNTEVHTISASISGTYPEAMYPVDKDLQLRVGAQVMIVKNNWDKQTGTFEYYNGNIGVIHRIGHFTIEIKLDDRIVVVEKATWENSEYSLKEKEIPIDETATRFKKQLVVERVVKGTFEQYPIKLAWAISINKSQGMTFDRINADLSECFAFGQVYVALSRCRSLNGVYLQSAIPRTAIKTDPRVLTFAETQTPDTLVIEKIERGKADKLYKSCRLEVNKGNYLEALNLFEEAIKIRNDRDTEGFRRYISLLGKQAVHYKEQAYLFFKQRLEVQQKLNSIRTESLEKETSLNVLKEQSSLKLIEANANIASLNKQVDRLEEKLEEKDKEIMSSRVDMQAQKIVWEREKEEQVHQLEKAKANYNSLATEAKAVIKTIETMTQQLKESNETILQLKEQKEEQAVKIKQLEVELARVKNLTWWQKLIGKK